MALALHTRKVHQKRRVPGNGMRLRQPEKIVKLPIVEMNAASDQVIWLFEMINCISKSQDRVIFELGRGIGFAKHG